MSGSQGSDLQDLSTRLEVYSELASARSAKNSLPVRITVLQGRFVFKSADNGGFEDGPALLN